MPTKANWQKKGSQIKFGETVVRMLAVKRQRTNRINRMANRVTQPHHTEEIDALIGRKVNDQVCRSLSGIFHDPKIVGASEECVASTLASVAIWREPANRCRRSVKHFWQVAPLPHGKVKAVDGSVGKLKIVFSLSCSKLNMLLNA